MFKDFVKKQTVGFWIVLAGIVVSIAALIMFEVALGTSQGYFRVSDNPVIVVLFVLALICALAVAALDQFEFDGGLRVVLSVVKEVLLVGVCAFLGLLVGFILNCISEEFVIQYFSILNVGTPKEAFMPAACAQGIASMILVAVALLTVIVAGFFRTKKD